MRFLIMLLVFAASFASAQTSEICVAEFSGAAACLNGTYAVGGSTFNGAAFYAKNDPSPAPGCGALYEVVLFSSQWTITSDRTTLPTSIEAECVSGLFLSNPWECAGDWEIAATSTVDPAVTVSEGACVTASPASPVPSTPPWTLLILFAALLGLARAALDLRSNQP